jgi:hypothetical protein
MAPCIGKLGGICGNEARKLAFLGHRSVFLEK